MGTRVSDQVRPMAGGKQQALVPAPALNIGVVAGHQNRGSRHTAPLLETCVMRAIKQTVQSLNTRESTVQKWEAGTKRPSGRALKLLSVVEKHGLKVLA